MLLLVFYRAFNQISLTRNRKETFIIKATSLNKTSKTSYLNNYSHVKNTVAQKTYWRCPDPILAYFMRLILAK